MHASFVDPTPGDVSLAAPAPHVARGMHWLIDCHGVDAALLTDAPSLRTLLRAAAEAAGARILFDHFHDFGIADGTTAGGATAGVTGVVLLAESHATIHTWPEAGFAAIDVFLCGTVDLDRAVACIERGLAPARMSVRREERGASR